MHIRRDNSRHIKARTGPDIRAKSWATEAAVRMLQNNLDPRVAEAPEELVVYGGIGRAARDWESFDRIVETLERLEGDETLLVQSGKPVGVFRTHEDAPRVLIANSNLVPKWATWEHFHELDRKGLMMYGQMTAGSWIYIGTQGIVQGTYETFVEMGRQHYGGDLKGRWILTAGLGGMGGAQPLAAVMAGAHCLAIECQESRIEKRLETRYLDRRADSLDEALAIIRTREVPTSVGLLGNAAEILPEMVRRGIRPDAVTDQTSAHDPVNGYLPIGWTVEEWIARAGARSREVEAAARASMAVHVEAMLAFRAKASRPSTMATTSARSRPTPASPTPSTFPVSSPLRPPALLPRHRPVPLGRAVGRSGGYLPHRREGEGAHPRRPHLHRWLDMARERIAFQGLPARICWVGLGQRHRLGMAFNEMVARGKSRRRSSSAGTISIRGRWRARTARRRRCATAPTPSRTGRPLPNPPPRGGTGRGGEPL